MAKQDLLFPTARYLFNTDEQLKPLVQEKFEHWAKLASDEAIAKAKQNLESKLHKVTVVENKKQALDLIKQTIPEGASVYNAGSTSLGEIGLTDLLKTHTSWNNLHTKISEEKNPYSPQAWELRRLAMGADYFLSSVCSISEDGDIVVVDGSGTRTGGFTFAAKNVLVVVGSNKIVPTYDIAVKRAYDYCLPLESARMRYAYKMPATALNYFVAIRSGFFLKDRIHVIIVKEHLGY